MSTLSSVLLGGTGLRMLATISYVRAWLDRKQEIGINERKKNYEIAQASFLMTAESTLDQL